MVTVGERITDLERALRTSQSNERLMATEIRSINARLAAADAESVEGRVGPGSIHAFEGARRAHRTSQVPDMGQGGLERLREDALIGSSIAGLTTPFAGTGNLLVDPAFEHPLQGPTLTTTYEDLGIFWEARYAVGSVEPGGSLYMNALPRVEPGPGGYSSSSFVEWGGEGTADDGPGTLYVRPKQSLTLVDNPQASFLVASVRMVHATSTAGLSNPGVLPTTLEAWVEIVDGTETVLATGDTVDLLALYEDGTSPIIFAAVEAPLTDGSVDYYWRLAVYVDNTDGLDCSWKVRAMEPSLSLSEEAAPMSYQPAIGAWVPAHYGPSAWWVTMDGNENNWDPWAGDTKTGAQLIVIDPGGAARIITGMVAPVYPWERYRILYNSTTDAAQTITLPNASGSSTAVNTFAFDTDLIIQRRHAITLAYFASAYDGTSPRWRILSDRT